MWFKSAAVCLVFLLALCRAQEDTHFSCTVTQNGDQVTYRVSDESRSPDCEASTCDVSWTGENNTLLAHNKEKMPTVIESSLNTLVTTGCIKKVIHKQHCTSKTTQRVTEFISVCNTTCAERREDKRDEKDEGGNSTEWTIEHKIAAGLGGLVLLLLLGLIFVRYTPRNKILSMFSCSQFGRRMLFMKTPINDPDPPAVVVIQQNTD